MSRIRLSCGKLHEESEILGAAGRIQVGRRKNTVAGPGRPRGPDRCPCGEMTAKRADARRHVCSVPQPESSHYPGGQPLPGQSSGA